MIALRLLVNILIFLTPAAIVGIGCHKRAKDSRGEWTLLAWVPIVPLLIWGVLMARDVTRDPTSHNLWPFELFLWGLVTLVLMGLFTIGRRFLGRQAPSEKSRR